MLSPSKATHAALCVPLLGIFLLMPPVVFLFMKPISIFGIPLLVAYIFTVWLGLILLARYMAKILSDDTADLPFDEPDEEQGP